MRLNLPVPYILFFLHCIHVLINITRSKVHHQPIFFSKYYTSAKWSRDVGISMTHGIMYIVQPSLI